MAENTQDTVPGWTRGVIGVVCAVVGVSAAAGLIASAIPWPKPAWGMFGFEIVQIAAAVIGILFARGWWREHPAHVMLCVALVFVVGSVLAFVAIKGQPIGTYFTPVMLARISCGFLIAALAAFVTLNRNPKSWRSMIVGSVLLMPLVLAAGAGMTSPGRSAIRAILGVSGFGGFALQTALFLVVTALLAAGIHLIIRAFESTRIEA